MIIKGTMTEITLPNDAIGRLVMVHWDSDNGFEAYYDEGQNT